VLLEGGSELRFRHYIHTPSFEGYSPDGAFLEVSMDGGETWELLIPEGGYPTRFDFSQGNPYPDQPAWGGRSEGWEPVVVPLDHVSGPAIFRFHFVSDFTGDHGIYEGWLVDEVLVRSWDRPHSAVFDPPVVDEGEVEVAFHVLPLIGGEKPGGIRLLRETGSERLTLGEWSFVGRLDEVVSSTDGEPGRVDRYWLEWSDGSGDRVGPLVVVHPGEAPFSLLGATPTLVRRGEGAGIRYRVPGTEPSRVTLDLFDLRGARLLRVEEGVRIPGVHHLPWPTRSDTGRPLSSGVYFLRLVGEGFAETRRVVLVP
jgi:hypothetical protein